MTGAAPSPATTTLLADDGTGLSLTLDDGVGVLTYNVPDAPINTLNSRMAPVFARCLGEIESNPAITAVVLFSGKPDSWIVGADIDELARVSTAKEGEKLSHDGQMLLDRLAAIGKPIIAAIHGAALGGGLEVALACHYRIATDHPKTVLALPEVQLGLLPAAGGTQRLPRLVGLRTALEMILASRNIKASRALQIGLVQELVHPSILRNVAMQRARECGRGAPLPTVRRRRAMVETLLEGTALGRGLVFRRARAGVMAKTKGRYPAPLAALNTVQRGYAEGFAAGLREEAVRFGELTVSAECRQLVAIFYATTALKKDSGLADGVVGTARDIRKVGIVGAGFMGAGIAGVAVQAGTVVRMKDASIERVNAGWRAVRDVLRERTRRRQMTRQQMQDTMSLLGPTTDYSGFANAQLVIEAVFEELTVKQHVLREIEAIAPDAIFASNTSTIPIANIAEASKTPGHVVGMHFFSPVHRMPLLEVIVTPRTGADTIASVVQYGRALGKTVIVVRDGPGFYVNRILAPYINEAGALLEEGARIEAIDSALVAFGFPVGPLTLLDEVGLDIAGKSGPIMAAAFGARMQPSAVLPRIIESGRLGRKSRRGFYRYSDTGKRLGVDDAVYELTAGGRTRRTMDAGEMQQRTVLPMLNEAVRCLDEGIIRSARDGDVGAVFGIGFPPFLGGPFRYIDQLGAATVVARLQLLDERFPGRFAPADRLRAMARDGSRFHS